MPPFVLFALLGAGAIAGLRLFGRMAEDLESARRAKRESASPRATAARDLGELEYDSDSGVYRPAQSRNRG